MVPFVYLARKSESDSTLKSVFIVILIILAILNILAPYLGFEDINDTFNKP